MAHLSFLDIFTLSRAHLAKTDTLYPVFIHLWSLLRPRQKELLADAKTDIVIEGFPRSANTYAASFFAIAQDNKVSIAHHLHESYQVRYAENRGLPCVILLREPLSAVTSAVLRNPKLTPASQLKTYILFHQNVLKYHKKAVISPFETIVSDFNSVIRQVNDRYNTTFLELAEGQEHLVKEEVDFRDQRAFGTDTPDPTRVASPSAEKKAANGAMREKITQELGTELAEAQRLYQAVQAL